LPQQLNFASVDIPTDLLNYTILSEMQENPTDLLGQMSAGALARLFRAGATCVERKDTSHVAVSGSLTIKYLN
jgi:hypothetical protein